MLKYDKVGFKKNGVWVIKDGEKVWMNIIGTEKFKPEVVKEYINKNYKEGQEIRLDYFENDNGYQVKSVISNTTFNNSNIDNSSAIKKNNNISNSHVEVFEHNRNYSIEFQNVGKSAAEIMKALVGRIDENNVCEIYEKVFSTIKKKVIDRK